MSIIIDLVVLAILVICIIMGYRRGLTGSLFKIISFVLAIVIAFLLFKPVSNFVIEKTDWDESLEQAIRQSIEVEETPNENEELKQNQSMPNVMVNYINNAVENAGQEAKNAIVESTARDVALIIIKAGVWIALFILSKIALILIKGIIKLLTSLPIIKQFDKFGGIIYGLLEALVFIYLLLAIISFVSPMMNGTGIIDAIQKSYICSFMYNNNLLLTLIF